MASHRYWGVRFVATTYWDGSTNAYTIAFAEVEMRATAGGANQCSGGSATWGSGYVNAPAQAFDANAATNFWARAYSYGLFGYVWASPVTVSEVALVLPDAAAGVPRGSVSAPLIVTIQGSDDGTQWHSYASMDCDTLRVDGGTIIVPVPAAVLGPQVSAQAEGHVMATSGAFAASATVQSLDPAAGRVDPMFGGVYRIAGDVAIAGTPDIPVSRRVRLLDRETGALVREVWSDPVTGAYAFNGLAPRTYIALSDDHTAVYNCAVADRLTPVR